MSVLALPDTFPVLLKSREKFLLRDDALLDEQFCQRIGLRRGWTREVPLCVTVSLNSRSHLPGRNRVTYANRFANYIDESLETSRSAILCAVDAMPLQVAAWNAPTHMVTWAIAYGQR